MRSKQTATMWQHHNGTALHVQIHEVILRRSKLIDTLNLSPVFTLTVAFK